MTSGNTPPNAARADQQAAAVRMRAAGASYRQIGERLGVNNTTAMRWVRDALTAHPPDPVEAAVRDYRAESHGLIDQVVDTHLETLADPQSANVLLRSVVTRARLEGLLAAPVPQPTGGAVWSGRILIGHRDGLVVDSATGDVITPAPDADHVMSEPTGPFDIIADPALVPPPTAEAGETAEAYNKRCKASAPGLMYGLDQRVNRDWSRPFRPEEWPGEPPAPPGR